jgi:hypothetical protein
VDAPLSPSIDAAMRRRWRDDASVVTQECVTFLRTKREHAPRPCRLIHSINRIDV